MMKLKLLNHVTLVSFSSKLQGGVKTLLIIFKWHDCVTLRDYLAFHPVTIFYFIYFLIMLGLKYAHVVLLFLITPSVTGKLILHCFKLFVVIFEDYKD